MHNLWNVNKRIQKRSFYLTGAQVSEESQFGLTEEVSLLLLLMESRSLLKWWVVYWFRWVLVESVEGKLIVDVVWCTGGKRRRLCYMFSHDGIENELRKLLNCCSNNRFKRWLCTGDVYKYRWFASFHVSLWFLRNRVCEWEGLDQVERLILKWSRICYY